MTNSNNTANKIAEFKLDQLKKIADQHSDITPMVVLNYIAELENHLNNLTNK